MEGDWRFICFTIDKYVSWARSVFLIIFLWGPVFLLKLLHRFLCGPTIWQIPAYSLWKIFVEQSNGFTTDSWVFVDFPLRIFLCLLFGWVGACLSTLGDFEFFGFSVPWWDSSQRAILAAADPPGSPRQWPGRQALCFQATYPASFSSGYRSQWQEAEKKHQCLPLPRPVGTALPTHRSLP